MYFNSNVIEQIIFHEHHETIILILYYLDSNFKRIIRQVFVSINSHHRDAQMIR